MLLMSGAVGTAIWNAGNPKYNPKPPALASYVIHAGSADCLKTLMAATAGRSNLNGLEVGSFLRLKEAAKKCGGTVELVKNPEHF